MGNLEFIEEQPLTMIEVNEELDKIEKRDKELTPRAKRTKEYLNKFAEGSKKDVEEMKKKIKDLNIPRLKDKHIMKIIDIRPKDIDGVKSIFGGEELSLKQEELQKVLECIR